jgi:hypothetical protein
VGYEAFNVFMDYVQDRQMNMFSRGQASSMYSYVSARRTLFGAREVTVDDNVTVPTPTATPPPAPPTPGPEDQPDDDGGIPLWVWVAVPSVLVIGAIIAIVVWAVWYT